MGMRWRTIAEFYTHAATATSAFVMKLMDPTSVDGFG